MDARNLDTELHKLLARLELMAGRMRRLQEENRGLRAQIEQMGSERAQLIARQEQARSRV